MKRIGFLVCLVSLLLMVFVAAPGNAHPQGTRDPFQPVVVPAAGAAGVPGTTVVPGTPEEPATEPAQTSEGLANTGGDPRSWILVAYALIAIGAGVVAIAKNAQPVRLQGPKREREISG